MKKYLLSTFLLLLVYSISSAQNFKGQWKGSFLDKSTSAVGWGGDRCDYVLELEVAGKTVTGFSYTYFTEGGKKYYTICSLKGYVNKAEKYIEVREYVRTKTNVPNTIRNCFQVHRLTYYKQSDTEMLEGSWIPAPDQSGGCGYGTTTLQRRLLKKNYALYNKPNPETRRIAGIAPVKKSPTLVERNKKASPPIAKEVPKKKDLVLTPKNGAVEEPLEIEADKVQDKVVAPTPNFEKRNNSILKTISVEHSNIKVDLYDNGEIDGDSISLFYNGKLLLSHKRLSDKPLSLNITVDDDKPLNELVMYAENLGSIPPNTALMVVMDGNSRYEVRITSDLQKSGTIRFIRKPPVTPGN